MFLHETTAEYQRALEFAKWCEPMLDRTPRQSAMHSQLDLARTTLLLKVAAGAGGGKRDESALAAAGTAALESAACLDLLFNKRVVSREELERGKELLQRLVPLLGARKAVEESHAGAA